MRGQMLLVGLVGVLTSLPETMSFAPSKEITCHSLAPSLSFHNKCHRRGHPSTRMFSSREEEIAKLEEQLRKLKEDSTVVEEEEAAVEPPKDDRVNQTGEPAMAAGKGDEFFFTEGDLDQQGILDSEGRDSNRLVTVGVAVAAVAFLAVFSQVPVGEENLQRYSSTAGSSSRIDLGDLNEERKKMDL